MKLKILPINQTASYYESRLEHREYYADKVLNLKPDGRRRLEVLAVRCLLKELTGAEQEVVYDPHGKPALKNSALHLSISHTDGYAAAIVGEKPVGIDIERRGRRVERVVSKFMQTSETALAGQLDDRLLAMHLIWSAKEAAFKVLGQDYYDLQNLTCVTSIDLGRKEITMNVVNMEKPLTIYFDYNEEFVLCYLTLS